MRKLSPQLNSAIVASALAALATLVPATVRAEGIIKHPGDHPKYSVELEPHGLLDWDSYYWGGTGYGLGMHAAIPIVDNGPVTTINNNLAIGFGLDWSHFENDNCGFYINRGGGVVINGGVCDAVSNTLRFPVYAQWNFFFTKVVGVFGEAGFGIYHTWFESDYVCGNGFCSNNHTSVFPYFEGGGRFLFGDTVGLLVRIGYPYFTVGAGFLL